MLHVAIWYVSIRPVVMRVKEDYFKILFVLFLFVFNLMCLLECFLYHVLLVIIMELVNFYFVLSFGC